MFLTLVIILLLHLLHDHPDFVDRCMVLSPRRRTADDLHLAFEVIDCLLVGFLGYVSLAAAMSTTERRQCDIDLLGTLY
jgi:hypothetical protein